MNNDNKTLIYVLCGVVAALLVALVGVLAYNFGKDKGSEGESMANTESVAETTTAPQAMTQETPQESATSAAPAPATVPAPAPEPKEDMRDRYSWHLVGTIAGKSVVLDLSRDDYGNLTGSYYYTKFGSNSILQLEGTMEGGGRIYLSEYNTDKGIISGYLEGRMTSSGALTGSFTNSKGNTYKVSLKVK